MFGFARWVTQHKVLVVAVFAAFFIFFGGKQEEVKPANPWSANAPEQVAVTSSSKKDSMTDKAFGVVAGAAKKYADVDISGVDPKKLQESTVSNFQGAEDGMKKANGGN